MKGLLANKERILSTQVLEESDLTGEKRDTDVSSLWSQSLPPVAVEMQVRPNLPEIFP